MQTDLTNPATNDSERGQVSTSAAEIYDRFFLPALFARCAAPVVEAAGIAAGDRVLDVACGTGVLALEARRRGATVTGLDRNAGMLAVARTKAGDIDWVEGMAESLPMRDATFDAVVSQFGLMFFEDRVAALREMRRVLKPGGRMAVAVWGGAEGHARLFGDGGTARPAVRRRDGKRAERALLPRRHECVAGAFRGSGHGRCADRPA